ncbi:uncharacterized protein ATNIH1004_007561 [Aspergillus tanneri]|uniref:Uncharacterized protein n=1 Tax=Aspergillus tanneri TaxID=1220188 RepID=A0A5M9MGM5_9EURO|nr:uncharacterized protein ATNIH1004_007561 [Aspergillus tanneri]KAA8646135.1 hypothetical protein ATNIH1004_007561 [Aspergillus tanneri]
MDQQRSNRECLRGRKEKPLTILDYDPSLGLLPASVVTDRRTKTGVPVVLHAKHGDWPNPDTMDRRSRGAAVSTVNRGAATARRSPSEGFFHPSYHEYHRRRHPVCVCRSVSRRRNAVEESEMLRRTLLGETRDNGDDPRSESLFRLQSAGLDGAIWVRAVLVLRQSGLR